MGEGDEGVRLKNSTIFEYWHYAVTSQSSFRVLLKFKISMLDEFIIHKSYRLTTK